MITFISGRVHSVRADSLTVVTAQERMQLAREASRSVGLLSDAAKSALLHEIARALDAHVEEIVAANAETVLGTGLLVTGRPPTD